MYERNSWLFPVMVIAAASVVAFGCVGVVAISAELARSRSASADAPLSSLELSADSQLQTEVEATQHAKGKQLTTATMATGLKPPRSE